MVRRFVPLLVSCAAAFVLAPSASAATRTATTSEGVRLTLGGRMVTLTVPQHTESDSRLTVECGYAFTNTTGTRRGVRAGQRVTVRLRRSLPFAEWCAFFTVERSGTHGPEGAAVLEPRLGPPPARVQPGPGVRVARTDHLDDTSLLRGEGTVEFRLKDRTLTVELSVPFRRSSVVFLGCFVDGNHPENAIRGRVAVQAGRRILTAQLVGKPDPATLRLCLLEGSLNSGADIALVNLPAPA